MSDTVVFIDVDSILFKIASPKKAASGKKVYPTKYQMRTRYGKTISDIEKTTFSTQSIVGIKGAHKNFRYDLHPDYKGTRPELESEMKENLNYLHEYALSLGAVPARDGWETDDEVAEWTREAYNEGMNYVIAHIDKDLDMLPGQHYNYNKDTFYDVDLDGALMHFYTQLLVGDTSDNIPGVRGIGPVKAAKLLGGCTPETVFDVVSTQWNDRSGMDLSARLLFMGDPDKFTYDLRELYAEEKEGKEEATCVATVSKLEPEGEPVLCGDDLEDGETSEGLLRVEPDSTELDGSEEGST